MAKYFKILRDMDQRNGSTVEPRDRILQINTTPDGVRLWVKGAGVEMSVDEAFQVANLLMKAGRERIKELTEVKPSS